jgi:hypothetical protein
VFFSAGRLAVECVTLLLLHTLQNSVKVLGIAQIGKTKINTEFLSGKYQK